MNEEPHFGEVWQWGGSPPLMVIAIHPRLADGRQYLTLTYAGRAEVIDLMLYGTDPREGIRAQWKRLDTEDLSE